MLYQDLLKHWVAEQALYLKERTVKRYEEIITIHILPRFKDTLLENIKGEMITSFVSDLSKIGNKKTSKNLSYNSIVQIVGVLKRTIEYAVERNIILVNPIPKLKIKAKEKSIGAFTEYEQKIIVDYIHQKRNLRLYGVIIALYTGLRIGELLALTWDDIDFKQHTIRVNKTLSPIKLMEEEKFITSPKTISAIRIIPFTKNLVPYLKKLKTQDSDYVLSSRRKGPIMISSYQFTFKTLLERTHLEHRGFHALRHTFATRALELGADLKTLSEILGHSNPTITLNRYVHSTEKQRKMLVNKIGMKLEYTEFPKKKKKRINK